ncbi:hypothetical protein VPH35_076642 [Triticum aestivum]
MGHLLAPSTKHNYATIDFWGALANPEMIQQFNWCEYVLQCLIDAVTKLRRDISMGTQTINLTSCHLFPRVFFLDNLDLWIFNKKHDAIPRISVFDQDTLRRMITMATDVGSSPYTYSSAPLRGSSLVCYTRGNFTSSVHRRREVAQTPACNKIPGRRLDMSDPEAPHVHLFGTSTRAIPRRKYVTATGFASDPWMIGYCPPPAKGSSLTQSLQEFTRTASPEILNRSAQTSDSSLYMEENPDKPYMSYAHFMDLDFSTLVLAGQDYTRLAHIQDQFIGSEIMYPLHACQLFYVPSTMSHGCVLYIWDMVTSTIHVLDPMSGSSGCTPSVKARHEAAVSIFHDGLFTCLTEFFSGWPPGPHLAYITITHYITAAAIHREDSAVCVLHLLRHFDGKKSRVPLTKANIDKTRQFAFYELFRLQGNKSSVPADIMWGILAPPEMEDQTSSAAV